MSGVGVRVDAAKEGCCGVLAGVLCEEAGTAWVVIHESGDVVEEAGDEDNGARFGFLLDCRVNAIVLVRMRNREGGGREKTYMFARRRWGGLARRLASRGCPGCFSALLASSTRRPSRPHWRETLSGGWRVPGRHRLR